MISNIFFKKFLSESTIGRKFFIAFLLILLSFLLLLGWILRDFNQKLEQSRLQLESAQYHNDLRKIYEAVALQQFDKDSAVEDYLETAFTQLIDFDKKVQDGLKTAPHYLAKKRPGVGTPESIFYQWKQNNITIDSSTKLRLFETIEEQLASLMRYVTDNIPSGNGEELYFYRFQTLLDPSVPPKQNVALWKELLADMEDAGMPKVALADFPKENDLNNMANLREASFFLEEMGRQEKGLMELELDKLIGDRRKSLFILLLLSCALLALGTYFLWYIYKPLVNMLEINKRFAKGDFSIRYQSENNDEIGALGKAFNALYAMISEIDTHVNTAEKLLKASSEGILKTADVQQDTIIEQEKIARQIGVKAYDISETSKELSETMGEINQASESASTLAQDGKMHLQQLETIMQKLVGASNHLVSTLSSLNDKTQGVTSIISTMVHVAGETNMLYLNTSLEASKAKQLGKGFAIIAGEIKRLADQTAVATLNIETEIKEILDMMDQSLHQVQLISDEILSSVDKASQVQLHFIEIFDKVQYVSGKFNAVDATMRSQLQNARDIDGSIQLLKVVSQDSTRTIKQFRSSLQELNNTLSELHQAKNEDRRQ